MTCYELAIRLTREQKALMGKSKYVRNVYARSKKEDLAQQQRDFEPIFSRSYERRR